MEQEAGTAGWDAIEEQMSRIYNGQKPKHYGTLVPYMLGGNDPLTGISAYKAESPSPHWHFVTFGFSELYDKESEDPEISGYGFELTFRLARRAEEQEPPAWALNLLQNMGRYVFQTGNIFEAGHHLDANGPICLESDTKLTALVFMTDPQLPPIHTPNGQVEFIQMIGITADELEAVVTWNTRAWLEACHEALPFYITDLSRPSLLELPQIAEAVRQGIERDGSSTGFYYVDQLSWDPGSKKLFSQTPATLTMGAKQAAGVAALLRGRLLKDRSLILSSRELFVSLERGSKTGWEASSDNGIRLTLSDHAIQELLGALRPVEGSITLADNKALAIQVVKTYIKDQNGNVVETIG